MPRERIQIGDLDVKVYRLIECTRSAGVSVVGTSHIDESAAGQMFVL